MSIATEISRLQSAKSDLKTAINAKLNSGLITDEKIDEYSDFVDNIQTDGGGSLIEKDVNFYDYDGTLVASYTLAEAQALDSLPTPPDHSGDTIPLTFQEWNHTLAQINALSSKRDVGATYITTDGKTHLLATFNEVTGVQPTLHMYTQSTGEITVDWGDGEISSATFTGNASFTKPNAYASYGQYDITITSAVSFRLGSGTSSSAIISSGQTDPYTYSINKVFCGTNLVAISNYGFYYNYSLAAISCSTSLLTIGQSSMGHCYRLKAFIVPRSASLNKSNTFYYCTNIEIISVPVTVSYAGSNQLYYNCYNLRHIVSANTIGGSDYYSCYKIKEFIIPSNVMTIGFYAFYNAGLVNITIPSSVTSLSNGVFEGNRFLTEIIFESTTPPTITSTTFGSSTTIINAQTKILVPYSADHSVLNAYKTATNWTVYSAYIFERAQ